MYLDIYIEGIYAIDIILESSFVNSVNVHERDFYHFIKAIMSCLSRMQFVYVKAKK